MDGGLNKIATALITVFLLTFLLLVAQIIYVLSRRPHLVYDGGQAKEKCVYLFCWRNQSSSRIQPKEIASKIHDDPEAAAAVDDELDKWRELCGPSRELFTINEEEEREGIESFEFEYDPPKLKRLSSDSDPEAVDVEDTDTTPFHTPCASPPYFTPSPSPTRDAGEFPADQDSSDQNRTAPFWGIEIISGH